MREAPARDLACLVQPLLGTLPGEVVDVDVNDLAGCICVDLEDQSV
ncbi:MAG: hypothetical protein ACKVIY_00050 [Acidimicrobiales bacterium]